MDLVSWLKMYKRRKKNSLEMNLKLKKDSLNIGLLILIIFISFLTDQYYLKNNLNLPAWDQGYRLTNLFKTYNIF